MKTLNRWIIYSIGMLILAMGLTLNTKAGLGVSPIISLSYAMSEIWHLNFGDVTFCSIHCLSLENSSSTGASAW